MYAAVAVERADDVVLLLHGVADFSISDLLMEMILRCA